MRTPPATITPRARLWFPPGEAALTLRLALPSSQLDWSGRYRVITSVKPPRAQSSASSRTADGNADSAASGRLLHTNSAAGDRVRGLLLGALPPISFDLEGHHATGHAVQAVARRTQLLREVVELTRECHHAGRKPDFERIAWG